LTGGGTLKTLGDALENREPVRLDELGKPEAAVAAILTDERDPSLLFIHRVAHDRDPWSGHLAFPGGRIEELDASPRRAAERETREEIGLDLSDGRVLGQLDEITGSTILLCVACYVYLVGRLPDLDLNEEVADAFTVSLSGLADRDRWVEAEFEIKGVRRSYPAIDLGLDGKPLLWGLTYRFVTQILEHAGLGGGSRE